LQIFIFSRYQTVAVFDMNREEGDMMIFETITYDRNSEHPWFLDVDPHKPKIYVTSYFEFDLYDIGDCLRSPEYCK